jgi:DNA-binding PadR family transcriptional regulator
LAAACVVRRPDRPPPDLSPAAWASLALLTEQPAHGFAVARALAPGGEVGRVWSCSRPLVYRALGVLTEAGLVEERGSEPGDAGPRRRVLGATRSGRREVERWLRQPATHVRDLRSDLMLKLLFLSRRGEDASALLAEQQAALEPVVEGLEVAAGRADGFDRVLYLWRLESARAALRFVEDVSSEARAASPSP